MENENERSVIAAALDEALRDQVKRLFAVLAMSMVDDGGSNVARDKAEKRRTIGLKIVGQPGVAMMMPLRAGPRVDASLVPHRMGGNTIGPV